MRLSLRYKNTRYLYWVTVAFFKKNIQAFILSFLISLIGIIAVVSFSPYIIRTLTIHTQTIGIAGSYRLDSLPEEVTSKLSNGLVYLNDNGDLIPLLIDGWVVSDGGKTYRFTLKKDIFWNDGKAFEAKDIPYSFKDVEIRVENPRTVSYHLPKPLRIFPHFLSKPVIRYPLIGVAGNYRADKIKFTGEYVSELRLTPQRSGQPVLMYKFYDTDTKLVQAYKLGQITQMSTTKSSVGELFGHYPNSKVERNVDYTRLTALYFNMKDPLLKEDKDIRHAIAQSIKRSDLSEYGVEANGPIPPVSWAYEQDVKTFPYNPSVASKILKKYTEASGSAGLTISTYYDYLSVADKIKDDLEQVGMTAHVEVLSGELPDSFQLLLASISLPKDPDQYFFWHSTQKRGNISNYRNDRVDLILEQGRNAAKLKDRKALYSDFQKILVNDMPAFFLFHPYLYTVKRI